MEQNKVSISTGIVWNSRIEDMEETLKEADRCMYVEKDKYHKMTGGVVLWLRNWQNITIFHYTARNC